MIRRMIILLGATLIAGVIGLVAWNSLQGPFTNGARAAQSSYSEEDLVLARVGTLVATVSATGAIEPKTAASIAFVTSGNVGEVLVKRGEKVKAGQPLARLDSTALELQLKQAEASLASAKAALAKLEKGAAPSQLAAAQANLASAQAAYNKLLKPDPAEVAIAKADVEKAKATLDQAQAAYDRIGGASNPQIGMLPQALQLQSATLDYQKAVEAYNSKFKPTDAQLKAALAQVQAARDNLARLSPQAEDIVQAQANVESAQAARDLAQQRVKETTLLAPISGTVTILDLDPGVFAQAGRAVITIADLDHLRIKLNIDETDIPRIKPGQSVSLDLDAFPDQTVEGTVAEIAPAATTVQGVVNYEVEIILQPSSLDVKPGMTANANIEVAHKENVLLIPTRAIRAEGNRRVVTVLEGGQPRQVAVTLGLSNDIETEIVSGLTEGQQVLTTPVTSPLPGFGGSR